MKNLILFLLIFAINIATAQTEKDLQAAFLNSYTAEAKSDFNNAIGTLKKVYSANSYETNLRLGWLSYKNAQYAESVGYYEKAIALKPMSIEARQGYISPAVALGYWDKVLAQHDAILKIDPMNAKSNFYAGQIYYYRKDYARAEKFFEKVINLYPFDYDGLLMMGWTKYFLGKKGEAKILFNKVLLYSPTDASALEGLSYCK